MKNITGIHALKLVFFLLDWKPNSVLPTFLRREISLQKGKPQLTCSDLNVKVMLYLQVPHPPAL